MAYSPSTSDTPEDEITISVSIPPQIDAATIAIQHLSINSTSSDTSSLKTDSKLSHTDSTSSLVPEPSREVANSSDWHPCVSPSTSLESNQSDDLGKMPDCKEGSKKNGESSCEEPSQNKSEDSSEELRPNSGTRPRLNMAAAKRMIFANLGMIPGSPERSGAKKEREKEPKSM